MGTPYLLQILITAIPERQKLRSCEESSDPRLLLHSIASLHLQSTYGRNYVVNQVWSKTEKEREREGQREQPDR